MKAYLHTNELKLWLSTRVQVHLVIFCYKDIYVDRNESEDSRKLICSCPQSITSKQLTVNKMQQKKWELYCRSSEKKTHVRTLIKRYIACSNSHLYWIAYLWMTSTLFQDEQILFRVRTLLLHSNILLKEFDILILISPKRENLYISSFFKRWQYSGKATDDHTTFTMTTYLRCNIEFFVMFLIFYAFYKIN